MGDTRENTGGMKLWHEGERVSYGDLNRVGRILQRDVLHLLGEVFRTSGDAAPQAGVFGGSFLCSNPAGLDIEVEIGLGLYYDSAETDDWDSHYKPVALEAAETVTLSAHDPADPRIDLISIEPATDDDIPETDNIRDPATGTVTSQSKDQRRRWYGTVTVTEGTPGAGAPAWPAGHLHLCEVTVPAAAGAPTLVDERTKIKIAKTMLDQPSILIELTPGAVVAAGVPGPVDDYCDVALQVKDLATGEDLEAAVNLGVEVFNYQFLDSIADVTWNLAPASGGSTQYGANYARGAITTDVDGSAIIRITNMSANTGALLRVFPEGNTSSDYYGPAAHAELPMV